MEQMQVFNVGEDCPVFSQMFQFCQVAFHQCEPRWQFPWQVK